MIDLHCHILHALDDGPDSIDEAVAMAKLASADGIKQIIATPHISDQVVRPDTLKNQLLQLNDRLAVLGIPLEIFFGAELSSQLSIDLLQGFTINNSSYLLIEFPHSHLPATARETIFNLRAHGYFPIIAHPERNPSIISDPPRVLKLLDDGVYLQITAASIAGKFGRKVKKCAIKLLKMGLVHFIGTDSHSSSWRRPLLSAGVKEAGKIIGKENALKLVTVNPAAVLSGIPLF